MKEITILLGRNKREERVVSLQWTTRPGRVIAISFRGIYAFTHNFLDWKYVTLHLGRIGWITISVNRNNGKD